MNDRVCNFIKNPLILVIDMQNIYSAGQKWECSNFKRTIERIRLLLDCSTGEKVVFTRYIASANPIGVWADYNAENEEVNADKWSNEIIDELKPYAEKYKSYDKSVYSSYSHDKVKKEAKASTCVIVSGVVAECCVLSTVMSLIDAGIYVIYLKDAVAGIDEEAEKATIKVLEGLAPLHLSIMSTEEYLEMKGRKILRRIYGRNN